MSADRADFVSKLFSKKRPEGLDRNSTAAEIFAAFKSVESSEALYKDNLKAIDDLLLDQTSLRAVGRRCAGRRIRVPRLFQLRAALNYSSTGGFGGRYQPSYADLMAGTDEQGCRGAFWPTKTTSRVEVARDEEPDRPGRRQLRGPESDSRGRRYLKSHDAPSSAFYLSNVEQYLSRIASGRTSAATWRRCRSTRRARSSAPCAAADSVRAWGSTPSWAACRPR